MSANRDVWWDNSAAAHLGFVPQDSSEVFRDKVEAAATGGADRPQRHLPGRRLHRPGPASATDATARPQHASRTRRRRPQRRPAKARSGRVAEQALVLGRHPGARSCTASARPPAPHAAGPRDEMLGLHRAARRRCRARGSPAWKAACSRSTCRRPTARSRPRGSPPVAHAAPGMRFNDGRCDRQGRFWAGTMVLDMGAGAPRRPALPLRRRAASGAVAAARRPDRAQRPGLQPRRPHDVPVGLAPGTCRPSGPSTTTPPPARRATAACSST